MNTLTVYYADWCKPCQRTKLVLQNIKKNPIYFVDIEEHGRRGITNLPTTIIYNDEDAEQEKIVGELYEEDLEYLKTKYGIE